MPEVRLLAVDPSLTCSGWALFDVPGEQLIGVGKIRSLGTSHSYAERLNDLQRKISGLLATLGLGANDVLVCEAQTTMRDPRAAFRVEQVRGIFETLCRARGSSVPGRLNPRSVQREVMGLCGRQLPRADVKAAALEVARGLFGEQLARLGIETEGARLRKHQDIVDAILVGYLALTRIRTAAHAGVELSAQFAEVSAVSTRSLRAWRGGGR